MGQLKAFIAQILGFDGWEVVQVYCETPQGVRFVPVSVLPWCCDSIIVVRVARRWLGYCSICGRRCAHVHEHTKLRRWRDLPWTGRTVMIEYAPDRLKCDACRRTPVELLPWAGRFQRETTRFEQHLGLQAQSMPTSHVAAQYGVDWHCVRRAEHHALQRWDATRKAEPLTMVGIDEKYLGRRNRFDDKYITIISNLNTGEPIWIGFGRSEATVKRWLDTLTEQNKADIKLFAMDMHTPFMNAIYADPALRHAEIAHDPFHVMKRAVQAMDELRRQVLFRGGPEMRALGRGRRWLFLRAWNRCTVGQQQQLSLILRCNRRLAHGYQILEQLRDALHAPTELAMIIGLTHVLRRTARRDNVPMRKLHDSLLGHMCQIVALARHRPATGRIEALNNNWETAVRQARGYRNLQFLMLKVRFMTANPIRDRNGLRRFLALGMPVPYRAAA